MRGREGLMFLFRKHSCVFRGAQWNKGKNVHAINVPFIFFKKKQTDFCRLGVIY